MSQFDDDASLDMSEHMYGSSVYSEAKALGSRRLHFFLTLPFKVDGRQRLSQHWIPTARGTNADPENDDVHTLLVKTGFLHQAYSGVFQLLPLGLRVQEKIEKLADKHMRSLGASKLSLSSLSSEALWRKSGRLQGESATELIRLKSRAKDAFLLAPTHEEEITALVADAVRTPKDLPLRLYQISRKYRDERRPRHGLLRAREFTMKDLYTFDADEASALATYEHVRAAYDAFFAELRLPYLVADAESGAMGGSLSHEFHLPLPEGEDTLFACSACTYTANEERAHTYRPSTGTTTTTGAVRSWTALTRDGRGLVAVFYTAPVPDPTNNNDTTTDQPPPPPPPPPPTNPRDDINPHALRTLIPNLDTSHEDALATWLRNIDAAPADPSPSFSLTTVTDVQGADAAALATAELLFQELLAARIAQANTARDDARPPRPPVRLAARRLLSTRELQRVRAGDACPSCRAGPLRALRAVELAHTFHLGARYSAPLGLRAAPDGPAVQMGCHGIGVSRLIGAVAGALRDARGLGWPAAVAPFGAVVVPGARAHEDGVCEVYDLLTGAGAGDVVVDDRAGSSLVQKLKDADLVGYPVLVVLGRAWVEGRRCEVQCRRLGIVKTVALEELAATVAELLRQL